MPIPGNAPSAGKKPSTPTIGAATAGTTNVSVAFTPSTYIGKGTITYTATLNPGGFTGTGSSSPITVSGLTSGTAYTFSIVGTTNYGVNSDASAFSNAATPTCAVPTTGSPGLSLTVSGTTLTLTVGTYGNSPTSYVVRVAAGLSNFQNGINVLYNPAGTATTYTITGASYDTTYYAGVSAVNACGSSGEGQTSATTGAAPNLAPIANGAPSVSVVNTNGVQIDTTTWQNNPTSYRYRVYRYSDNALVGDSQSASTALSSFTVAGLAYSTTYYATQEAANAYGSSTVTGSPLALTGMGQDIVYTQWTCTYYEWYESYGNCTAPGVCGMPYDNGRGGCEA